MPGDRFFDPLPGGGVGLDDLSDVDTTTVAPTGGQALVYDSGSGLWVPGTVGGGSGGGATGVIARSVVGAGGVASIDFSSIPSTYENLRIVVMGRGTAASAVTNVELRFNGDTAANYRRADWFGGASTGNGSTIGLSSIRIGTLVAATGAANSPGMAVADIAGYARTVFHKMVTARGADSRGTTAATQFLELRMGLWASTAAINQITLFPPSGNFAEGTVATLYGLNGA